MSGVVANQGEKDGITGAQVSHVKREEERQRVLLVRRVEEMRDGCRRPIGQIQYIQRKRMKSSSGAILDIRGRMGGVDGSSLRRR